jgi:hypothetical protein
MSDDDASKIWIRCAQNMDQVRPIELEGAEVCTMQLRGLQSHSSRIPKHTSRG